MLRMRLAAGIEEPAFQNNVLQGSKWASITCIVVSAPVIGRCSLTGTPVRPRDRQVLSDRHPCPPP